MYIQVQKYGGTSLADIACIQKVANRIKQSCTKDHKLVVVLSAMGNETDRLIETANRIYEKANGREMDLLLATGEIVSTSLMGIALARLNVSAVALTGAQAGIEVSCVHSNARILKIHTEYILKHFEKKQVCLVAGFQGRDKDGEIYTLGRGGSDTSATALAAALDAEECEICTDVDGVYTADPKQVHSAKKIPRICYEEMLELARLGAGVLHSRSIELASRHSITLHVRSSFNHVTGTLVVSEDQLLERAIVRGVSLKMDEGKVSVMNLADQPGLAAGLFGKLAEANLNVNMIVQSAPAKGLNTISFTVMKEHLEEARLLSEEFISEQKSGEIEIIPEVAVVSAVGIGMKSHSGVASSMFAALAKIGTNIDMISTSEIKISVVVHPDEGNRVLEAIHQAFNLGNEPF